MNKERKIPHSSTESKCIFSKYKDKIPNVFILNEMIQIKSIRRKEDVFMVNLCFVIIFFY